jgi:hypothetical protein
VCSWDLLQAFAQVGDCPRELLGDSPDRTTEPTGDVGYGKTVKIAEQQDLLFAIRHARERGEQEGGLIFIR